MVNKSITLSSDPASIIDLEKYLHEILDEYKFCEAKFPEILISLTEAVNNAIIHGNKKDINKHVQINCESKTKGIYFRVQDEGAGFDPSAVPDPTDESTIHFCGGRGVYIINALADKVDYTNNGNTLEIFFKLGDGRH
jgi:serine/threonine-protein kinase RsbW